jgi:cation diffusion facilitator CzcD-associated flavoprotein CzcO
MKRLVRKRQEGLLPAGYDIDTHFTPSYDPWDQRLCLVPNGDLFTALGKGSASVVTDHIDTFTETGIKLRSGAELPADVIVTATGLNLLALGGIELAVDG